MRNIRRIKHISKKLKVREKKGINGRHFKTNIAPLTDRGRPFHQTSNHPTVAIGRGVKKSIIDEENEVEDVDGRTLRENDVRDRWKTLKT